MRVGSGGEMQRWEVLAGDGSPRAKVAVVCAPRRTPSGNKAKLRIGVIFQANGTNKLPKTRKTSEWAAVYGLRGGSIRKKVIGHGMRPIPAGIRRSKHIRNASRTFALLHKPARQHGNGVFFHPLVQQRPNFLSEIGGMGKTRQLKTLKRVPRSGQKELPGWLR